MKLFLKAWTFALVLCAFVACDNANEVKIPKTLAGTAWKTTDYTSNIVSKLEFGGDNTAYYVSTTYTDSSKQVESSKIEYEFNYEYVKPAVTLTPVTPGAPELQGKIVGGESYNLITLTNSDGSLFFEAFEERDHIWAE